MKGPLYRSDDGQKEGTREEVEAYEASLNPLAKFKFPWHRESGGLWENSNNDLALGQVTNNQAIALLNLMPLVEELRCSFSEAFPDWRVRHFDWRMNRDTRDLLLAYEKALGVKS